MFCILCYRAIQIIFGLSRLLLVSLYFKFPTLYSGNQGLPMFVLHMSKSLHPILFHVIIIVESLYYVVDFFITDSISFACYHASTSTYACAIFISKTRYFLKDKHPDLHKKDGPIRLSLHPYLYVHSDRAYELSNRATISGEISRSIYQFFYQILECSHKY